MTNTPQSVNSSDELPDSIKNNALTVAEAIDKEPGYWIAVKGYIVAAAESSIKNADFRAPFAGKTAILLADEPSDGTDEQLFDNLMPISLSDAAKGISASFNLQENANRWNKFVYIYGIRKQYMSAPGIKEVKNIWIGDPDEQPDPVVDPDTNPDDTENPIVDENEETIKGKKVYTIEQVLSNNALLDHTIWVKGYIIASAKRSMESMDYDEPFDSDMAIILASKPISAEEFLHIKENKDYKGLFPVVLSAQFQETKDIVNLKNNPTNHNKLAYILGNVTTTSVGPLGFSPTIDAVLP